MGYDPATDLKIRALSNIGDEEQLEEMFGVDDVQVVRLPRGAVGRDRVPGARRPPRLRGRLHRADRRPRDGRAAARRRARLAVRHRALQDRQPAVPLQHHGPVVPVPARASASAAAGCAASARSPGAATTWSSCAASTSGPRPWATSPCRSTGVERDYFVRAVRDDEPRRARRLGGERPRPSPSTTRIRDEIERRLRDRLGVKIRGRGRRPRRARRVDGRRTCRRSSSGSATSATSDHRVPKSRRRAMPGVVYNMQPQPPIEENTRWFPAGVVTIGVEYREVDPENLVATYQDSPEDMAELQERSPEGGFTDEGVSLHVRGTEPTATSTSASTCSTPSPTTTTSGPTGDHNNVVPFDPVADGDMLPWAARPAAEPARRDARRGRWRRARAATRPRARRPRRRRGRRHRRAGPGVPARRSRRHLTRHPSGCAGSIAKLLKSTL